MWGLKLANRFHVPRLRSPHHWVSHGQLTVRSRSAHGTVSQFTFRSRLAHDKAGQLTVRLVSSRSCHVQLTVGHDQLTVRSRSAHGRSRSADGQLAFRSRSPHGRSRSGHVRSRPAYVQVTVRSRYGHGQLTVRSRSAHGRVTVSDSARIFKANAIYAYESSSF